MEDVLKSVRQHGREDVTIVMDKGMNAEENFSVIDAARGVTRADLGKKDINVREGCFLLHRLFVRAKSSTLLTLATLYNSHRAEYLTKYGYHVKRVYDQGLWGTGKVDLQVEEPND
jgi:transposase